MQNKDFYVYLHYRKTDGKPFYVGKGKGDRHLSEDRNPYWKRVAEKHGFESVIIFDCLTEKEAFALEVETILDLRLHGAKLTNLTDGGIGGHGVKSSKETNNKRVAARLKNGKDPRTGVKRDPEIGAKISKTLTGKKQSFSTRLKRSIKIRAELHFLYRHDKREFYNYQTGEVVEMTMYHFCEYTGLPKSNVHHMLTEKILTVGRWTIKGRDLSKSRAYGLKYIFSHIEHGNVEATPVEMRDTFGTPLSNLSSVISGKRKRCKGWSCKGPSLGL